MSTNSSQNLDQFLGSKPQGPYKKWLIRGGLLGLALILLFILSRCMGPDDAVSYVSEDVISGELKVTVTATGNLEPINQVDVSSEQSGLITDVYVDVNDTVEKGQVVAILDTSRLIDTVNQAKAQLAVTKANVETAKATASQSNADLKRFEEVSKLSGGKVPSKTEMDGARADYARAKASVASAEASVLQAEAALATAQTNLDKAQIYSPVNGVVLSRDIEPGQTVAASLSAPVLFTIAEDLTQMELQVDVDEADVGQVETGQSATFTVDAFPGESFPAEITRVNVGSNNSSSSSDSSSSSSSSSEVVAYTAVLSVDNPEKRLRPGMTATAEILTEEEKDALLIPNAALRFTPTQAVTDGGKGVAGVLVPGPRNTENSQTVQIGRGSQQTIYKLNAEGRPEPVTVKIGNSNGALTAVSVLNDDLKEGDKIIVGQVTAKKE